MELLITNTIEMVLWSESLESRLCQLYVRNNIVDIFWGQNLKEDDATWHIYVITHNLLRQCEKTEKIRNQVINFIAVEEGLSVPKSYHKTPMTHCQLERRPKKITKGF